MPLAYHLLAYKNPPQVDRLLNALYHPADLFVLHFDRRASPSLHHLGRRWAAECPNVMLQRPRAVLWGGSQIPSLQIEGMEMALRKSSSWTHFVNLSGQDFPLRPRAEIVMRLSACPETNFVDWFDPLASTVWRNADQRIHRWHLHFRWLHGLMKIPALGRRFGAIMGWRNSIPYVPGYYRPEPDFFRYFGGSNHAMINRGACEYLIHDPKARRIRRWLAATAIPDESTFQSVLLNGPYAVTVERRSGHYFEFLPDDPHPVTFRAEDFDRLIATGAYFARKFDTTIDARILDLIEDQLHTRP